MGPTAVLVLLIQQRHLWPVTAYASAATEAKEYSQVAQQPVVALALGSLSPSWLLVSLRDRESLDRILGQSKFQAWFCQKMLLSKSLDTSALHRKSEGVFSIKYNSH